MAKRRISVPEDHIALILPNQFSDELMSLAMGERNVWLAKERKYNASTDGQVQDLAQQAKNMASIWGDFILALLTAKEA